MLQNLINEYPYGIIKPMNRVITENRNENTKDIDLIPTIDILKKINKEDEIVAQAVKKALPEISLAVDKIVEQFLKGGKLFYFGAGTSGRLGVLDASECPPTFSVEPDMVQGIIAGGDRALRYAIEGAEDNFEAGEEDAEILKKDDVAVLISASGNPKYLLGVSNKAKQKGCAIIALTSNKEAKILDNADIKIALTLGAEAIAGSSRMKSGTAQKMILNMLSTASMVKIGKTYENFMIDVKPTNEKLKKRAVQIVSDICKIDENIAENTLIESNWKVKTAVLMSKKNISKSDAENLLKKYQGVLRKAINEN